MHAQIATKSNKTPVDGTIKTIHATKCRPLQYNIYKMYVFAYNIWDIMYKYIYIAISGILCIKIYLGKKYIEI